MRNYVLSKLAKSKISTIKKAEAAASEYDFRKLHITGANGAQKLISLLQLGRTIKGFGENGDLVWVIQFSESPSKNVTDEVWINAKTGNIQSMFPPTEN